MIQKTHFTLPASIAFAALSLLGCSKLVEVDLPKNQLTAPVVFADSSSATGALNNIYYVWANDYYKNFNRYIGLYSDEFIYTRTQNYTVEFQQSRVMPDNSWNRNMWNNLYRTIYACNDLIEQCSFNNSLNDQFKDRLIGEGKFLRALAYFYLVNLYGNVPLILQTDVIVNRQADRSDISVVYEQIINDLLAAKAILPITYPSLGKVRANRWAASALLARVYLYQEKWKDADTESTAVIRSGKYTPLDPPEAVFRAGSQESILQLWTQNGYVSDATSLIPSSETSVPEYVLSRGLNQSFEEGDTRQDWVGSNLVTDDDVTQVYSYPKKYKNRTSNSIAPEYLMVLRLSEQYLIRAESRAQLGEISGAIEDLNIVRARAGLPLLDANMTEVQCLEAILNERRIELFGEWGHRFFDLKRAGNLDEVIGNAKETWVTTAFFLPIPENELLANPNLTQNLGY